MPHNQQYLDTVLNPGQSSTQPTGFSSAQQSQQARGKSYASPTAGEAYEARQRREQAAQILGNLELLVWHANVKNEVRTLASQFYLFFFRYIRHCCLPARTKSLSENGICCKPIFWLGHGSSPIVIMHSRAAFNFYIYTRSTHHSVRSLQASRDAVHPFSVLFGRVHVGIACQINLIRICLARTRSNTLQSVAQTRQHFQNVQLGLPDEHLVLKEEYEIPSEQRVKRDEAGNIFHGSPARGSPAKSAKGKEKEKEKGKRRVMSSGM